MDYEESIVSTNYSGGAFLRDMILGWVLGGYCTVLVL